MHALVKLFFLGFITLSSLATFAGNKDCAKLVEIEKCVKNSGCEWIASMNTCVPGDSADTVTNMHHHRCNHSHHRFTLDLHSHCYWDDYYQECLYSY